MQNRLRKTRSPHECTKKMEVFHVGALQHRPKPIRGRRSRFSLEGNGLSVSERPVAWMKIARLGGEIYDLRRGDGLPGLFVDVTSNPEDLVMLAVTQKLIRPTTAWSCSYFDDEIESEVESLFETIEEAERECGDLAEPEQVDAFSITKNLEKLWGRDFSEDMPKVGPVAVSIAVLYAIEKLVPEVDGAWWNEELDVRSLSAPRGVIFKSRLRRWVATPTVYDHWGEDEDGGESEW